MDVIGQTDWYTCGPAAVATLFTYYYGVSTTEKEALELAEGFMREIGLEPGRGINALALKKTLEAKGILTKGVRVKPGDLRDYFARGGLPVVAHPTRPRKHFVVWGRSIIPFSSFIGERGYSGVVLVPIPPPDLIPYARSKQRATLEGAEDRLEALASLRD